MLEFEVTNTSTQYDANVVLECDEITHEAIDFSITPSTMKIKPNEVKTGNITITLNRAVYTENIIINFSCRLKATAGEKTKAEVIEEINNYAISGVLTDAEGNPLSKVSVAVQSEKQVIKTDRNGYFYVSGLERGLHHIYYKENEEEYNFSDEELNNYLIAEAATNGYLKIYNTNYKIDDYISSTNLEDLSSRCSFNVGTVWNFDYYEENNEGTYQIFNTYDCDGTYKIELWGAQGNHVSSTYYGGNGGYVSGNIELDVNQVLYVYVGGYNGYNGGGGYKMMTGWNSYSSEVAPGGGATDIRLVSGNFDNFDSLKSRIMVAAGGGAGLNFLASNGNTYSSHGGHAGGLEGYAGYPMSPNGCGVYGNDAGGTQTSGEGGNTSGKFGLAGVYNRDGGGGGWYGGSSNGCARGGGGGSSFISGHNGCLAINQELSTDFSHIVHKSDSVYSEKFVFTNTLMIDGNGYKWTNTIGEKEAMPNPDGGYFAEGIGKTGNGHARITLLN